jgi:hypothetical protein
MARRTMSKSRSRSRSRSRSKSRSKSRNRSASRSKSRGASRSKSRSRGRSRSLRGGMSAPETGSYSSASSYGSAVNGTGDQQFSRVFDQSGVGGKTQSNAAIGAQGQNSQGMGGGKRRRSRKNKKGGFWGEIINQAIVPLTLLGLNQKGRSMTSRKKH